MLINTFVRVARPAVMACLLVSSALATGSENQRKDAMQNELASLDSRFQRFSTRFYTAQVRTDKAPKIDSIGALGDAIEHYRSQDQVVNAITTIIKNRGLVEKNADTTPIINIYGLLLEANEWNTAVELYKKVKNQGDKSLVSNVSFSLAQYHFARHQWEETIAILGSIRSDLPPEDYHHALLMHAISLQRLQKHRVALREYAKIPPTSRYYVDARLNMAVANIRQDWWTDAHIILNELLNDKRYTNDSQLMDRLYTVMGYSLLQQQYFRNSRDAFRKVGLDGRYSNRALLGLALTAAYQEDFVGALNAVKILKKKNGRDLSVDEANLLIPFFYEKLKQLTTANTGYLEAIQYYEARIQNIKEAMASDPHPLRKQVTSTNTHDVTLNGEALNLNEKLPRFFFENLRMLARFEPKINVLSEATLKSEYLALNNDYQLFLRKAAQALLEEKISHVTHYMNQSRYGLARMQDHDAVAPP